MASIIEFRGRHDNVAVRVSFDPDDAGLAVAAFIDEVARTEGWAWAAGDRGDTVAGGRAAALFVLWWAERARQPQRGEERRAWPVWRRHMSGVAVVTLAERADAYIEVFLEEVNANDGWPVVERHLVRPAAPGGGPA